MRVPLLSQPRHVLWLLSTSFVWPSWTRASSSQATLAGSSGHAFLRPQMAQPKRVRAASTRLGLNLLALPLGQHDAKADEHKPAEATADRATDEGPVGVTPTLPCSGDCRQ